MKRALGVALAVATFALASPALANGRFPSANQLVVDPLDEKHLSARTTFGLLLSTDGARFGWICEKALGYEGTYDPAIAIAGGHVLVTLPDGISRSRDGCSWERVPIAPLPVVDLAVDPANPLRVVAITALAEAAPPGSRASLLESVDGGATFGRVFELPEDFRPLTVDVVGTRIYASGRAPFARLAMVIRSEDSGATWSELTFDTGGGDAYIAAVDRTTPDRLYVRIDGEAEDALLFSNDGARSFASILTAPELLGLALAPDGKQVAAGGPGFGVAIAGEDHTFRKVADHAVRCLTRAPSGLFACGTDPIDPFAIARFADGSFTPLLRLADLEPLGCPSSSTTGATCPAYWPEVSRTIKPTVDAGVDAGLDATSLEQPTASGGGCGCRTTYGSAASALPSLALMVALIAWRGISSMRPRLPCGRSSTASQCSSASPSRSSS